MSSKPTFIQDVAPPGGFTEYHHSYFRKRTVPGRVGPSSATLVLGTGLVIFGSHLVYIRAEKKRRREKELSRQYQMDILPLLQAEEDAWYVEEVERWRQKEREIMVDYPEWEVDKSPFTTRAANPSNTRAHC